MDNITNSLAEYSSTVNQYADKINGALLPVASILILTFFLFDIFSWNRRLGQEGGGLTVQLWMEVALGYAIAFLLHFYWFITFQKSLILSYLSLTGGLLLSMACYRIKHLSLIWILQV